MALELRSRLLSYGTRQMRVNLGSNLLELAFVCFFIVISVTSLVGTTNKQAKTKNEKLSRSRMRRGEVEINRVTSRSDVDRESHKSLLRCHDVSLRSSGATWAHAMCIRGSRRPAAAGVLAFCVAASSSDEELLSLAGHKASRRRGTPTECARAGSADSSRASRGMTHRCIRCPRAKPSRCSAGSRGSHRQST